MDNDIVVGSLVYDERLKITGVVVRENVNWVDTDGQNHWWDFEFMSGEELHYADRDELKLL